MTVLIIRAQPASPPCHTLPSTLLIPVRGIHSPSKYFLIIFNPHFRFRAMTLDLLRVEFFVVPLWFFFYLVFGCYYPLIVNVFLPGLPLTHPLPRSSFLRGIPPSYFLLRCWEGGVKGNPGKNLLTIKG